MRIKAQIIVDLNADLSNKFNTNRKAFTAYFPDAGARCYRKNRTNCGAPSVVMKAWSFCVLQKQKY